MFAYFNMLVLFFWIQFIFLNIPSKYFNFISFCKGSVSYICVSFYPVFWWRHKPRLTSSLVTWCLYVMLTVFIVFMALTLRQDNTASVYTRRNLRRDNINRCREWATVGRQKNWASIPGRSNRFLSSLKRPDWLWFLIHYIPRSLSPGLEWFECKTDHLPLSSAAGKYN